MKPVGVFYATREGHTLRIASRIAEVTRQAGVQADMHNVKKVGAEITLRNYSAVVLAASVHAGSHEPEMVEFVKKHCVDLDSRPNAFLSVTLSQVGAEDPRKSPEERARYAADVESVLAKFRNDTGWNPRQVKPVAGALLYSQYNFFLRFIMKRIARKSGAPTDSSRDYDFTRWADIEHFATQFAAQVRATEPVGQ